MESFVDGDGNIIVPKSIRPIIEYEQTCLGNRKGAGKQYRYGNLHILDYGNYYAVHSDRFDPRKSPLAHLLVDAPEYLAGAAAAIIAGKQIGTLVYKKRKTAGASEKQAAFDAVLAGYMAGSSAGKMIYNAANGIKKAKAKGK